MTLILRIFINMKHLIIILFLFFTSFFYSQAIYNYNDFYETVKIKYDTLYKENGSIKQIGKNKNNIMIKYFILINIRNINVIYKLK